MFQCLYFPSRPQNNLQLPFAKTVSNLIVVFYFEFSSFLIQKYVDIENVTIFLSCHCL